MKKHRILGAAALGTAVYAGVCGLLHYEVFHRNATLPTKIFNSQQKKTGGDTPAPLDPREEWMKAQSFDIWTLNNADGITLTAFYLPPEAPSDRWALCAHGYRSRGRREFRRITKFYHDHGFHVLLVDHRASGDSGGSRITFGEKESADLKLWLNRIRTQTDGAAEVVLHGVSMGAATVMLLSDDAEILPQVKFITADCGFTSVTDEFEGVLASANIPSGALMAGVDAINRLVSGFSLRDVRPIDHVSHALVPILFIHGAADTFVPTEMSQRNYEACTSEKAILLVEGAAHAESYSTDPDAYDAMLEEFIGKYMTAETATA